MDELLVVVVVLVCIAIGIGCLYLGGKLVWRSLKRSEPPIPPARIANAEGGERVYATSARATDVGGAVWRSTLFATGLALVAAPFAALYAIIDFARSFPSMSKGRVLRIRNRAQLAAPALGDGWAAALETRGLASDLPAAERAALGELWLITARMEHASVAAFSQLSLHLSALAAPAHLLEATHRAALDEIRHARACFAIARAITGARHTAGAIPALGTAHGGAIDLTRLAVGSLIDGCLGEGIAADVAAHGAARATEPVIRDTMTMIARDEAGHAELAWEVLAWCLAHDHAGVHAAVAARVDVLDREIAPRMPDLPGVDAAALARYGVLDQDALGALATARAAAVQARARAMVTETPAVVAARAA
jgi:hypothetical protein